MAESSCTTNAIYMQKMHVCAVACGNCGNCGNACIKSLNILEARTPQTHTPSALVRPSSSAMFVHHHNASNAFCIVRVDCVVIHCIRASISSSSTSSWAEFWKPEKLVYFFLSMMNLCVLLATIWCAMDTHSARNVVCTRNTFCHSSALQTRAVECASAFSFCEKKKKKTHTICNIRHNSQPSLANDMPTTHTHTHTRIV